MLKLPEANVVLDSFTGRDLNTARRHDDIERLNGSVECNVVTENVIPHEV